MSKKLSFDDYIITRKGEIINKNTNHTLKPQPNGKGYLRVSIGGKRYFIHRLVAGKYIPNPEQKEQVNHKDGNKANNCVENLEWVTNSENRTHAVAHSLIPCGEQCSWSKLTEKDVLEIRESSLSVKELAEYYEVSVSTIRDVISNRSWKNT